MESGGHKFGRSFGRSGKWVFQRKDTNGMRVRMDRLARTVRSWQAAKIARAVFCLMEREYYKTAIAWVDSGFEEFGGSDGWDSILSGRGPFLSRQTVWLWLWGRYSTDSQEWWEAWPVYNEINRQRARSPEATFITEDCSISELTHLKVQSIVMGVLVQVQRR